MQLSKLGIGGTKMVENRVCFTVRGEFGAQMSFEAKNTIPYEDLCKCINKDTLVELMCLDSLGYTGDDICGARS